MAINPFFGNGSRYAAPQRANQNPFFNQNQDPSSALGDAFRRSRLPSPFQLQNQQQPEEQDNSYMPQGTPALDAYRDYIKSMPQRENPGWWTRIAAAIGGASAGYKDPAKGVQVGQGIRDLPYQQKLEDWQAKEGSMRAAANLEGQDMGRVYGYRGKVDPTRMRTTSAETIAAGKNETAETIAAGRNTVARDKIESEIQMQEKELENKLVLGGMATERAKAVAKIQGDNMRSVAGIQVAGSLQRTEMQQEGANTRNEATISSREGIAAAANESRERVATTRMGTPVVGYENIVDQRDLQELATQYPKAVTQLKNGKYVPVKPPEAGFMDNADPQGNDMETAAQFNNLMAELQKRRGSRGTSTGMPPLQRPTKAVRPQTTPAPNPNQQSGTVTFTVNGRVADVPANEVQGFLKQFPNAVRQ